MKVFLVGSEGNMGSRYKAIFNHLGVKYHPHDLRQDFGGSFLTDAQYCSHILIATPTHTHFKLIIETAKYNLPILCEKPVTKNWHELSSLIDLAERMPINLRMVNQYEYMPLGEISDSDTVYNYYKHGGDSLVWDCINLVGLSEGKVRLYESSPQWICHINGRALNIKDMDGSYIKMIEHWLSDPIDNLPYIESSHNKVFDFLQGGGSIECNAGANRDSG